MNQENKHRNNDRSNEQFYDVIIIGGSAAGLAAAMTLGRALKNVLLIDSGKPCNRFTPYSHNFLTNDGKQPAEIMETARKEVKQYPTIHFLDDLAIAASGTDHDFNITTANNGQVKAKKLLFATGIKDLMPLISGFDQCWGVSIIHCPYCHGYEFSGQATGILMNGAAAVDFSMFIRNWTDQLTLFTNGPSTLTEEEHANLSAAGIHINENKISEFSHQSGQLQQVNFEDGSHQLIDAVYARLPFEQHCELPELMQCQMTESGHIQVDDFKKTTVAGIYAAGDNTTQFRSVAMAVFGGNLAGAMLNHELIKELQVPLYTS